MQAKRQRVLPSLRLSRAPRRGRAERSQRRPQRRAPQEPRGDWGAGWRAPSPGTKPPRRPTQTERPHRSSSHP
eukprot:9510448-Alexandrium_andersonii.AAC.1